MNNLVYIIEDNDFYSLLLKTHLETNHPEYEVYTYKFAESVSELLDRGKPPRFMIVDNQLKNGYYDNLTGIELVNKYKLIYPDVTFILHSVEEFSEPPNENCTVVHKGNTALDEISDIINKLDRKV